jgi:hypothetical protein
MANDVAGSGARRSHQGRVAIDGDRGAEIVPVGAVAGGELGLLIPDSVRASDFTLPLAAAFLLSCAQSPLRAGALRTRDDGTREAQSLS